jgi:hypothetical protein
MRIMHIKGLGENPKSSLRAEKFESGQERQGLNSLRNKWDRARTGRG